MKTKAPSPSSSASATASPILVPVDKLERNSWNPNRMTAAMFAKAIESIQTYGFIDPLLVREVGLDRYQIIDGEHRFDGGVSLGMREFPCMNLGLIDDARAKKLTIIMNELHGQADPGKMGDLLEDILKATSLDDLLIAMPYDEGVLAGFLNAGSLPELAPLEPQRAGASSPNEPAWVERLYRMPKEVALVVDEAIEKAKDGEEIEAWRALERVAADYLGS